MNLNGSGDRGVVGMRREHFMVKDRWMVFIFLILLVVVFLICSCSVKVDAPRITYVSIEDGYVVEDIEGFTGIDIDFSVSMNRYATEHGIAISGYDGDYHYVWSSDRSVCLLLCENLEPGCSYTLVIDGSCESEDGSDLGNTFFYGFYTYANGDDFGIVSFLPEDGETVDPARETTVRIGFSQPVECGGIYGMITIDPGLDFDYLFSEDRTVLDLMLRGIEANETYTVTIDSMLRADEGRMLGESYTSSFNTIGSNDSFSLEEAVAYGEENLLPLDTEWLSTTSGVEKDMRLMLEFSSPFHLQSIVDHISIDPFVSYSIRAEETALHFDFNGALAPGATYFISVDDSVKDRFGVTIEDGYEFGFTVDGTGSRPLYPVDITIRDSLGLSDTSIYLDDEPMHNETMLVEPSGEDEKVFFRIILSAPLAVYASLDRITLEKEYGNPDAESGFLSEYLWDGTDNSLLLTYIFPAVTSGGDALYRFTVTGGENGILDVNDNWMAEDIEIYVRRPIPD